jgi:agmatine deiminase
MTFRMPAEWERHERTLMCWPCREYSWGHTLEQGRREFTAVANAIAAFEPVTMVAKNAEQAAQARGMLAGNVDVVVRPGRDRGHDGLRQRGVLEGRCGRSHPGDMA